jgi:hypothetical protein
MMKGSGAITSMKPPSPSPSSMFYVHEADVVPSHHFLEECSLCSKSLSGDIFMYRHVRCRHVHLARRAENEIQLQVET